MFPHAPKSSVLTAPPALFYLVPTEVWETNAGMCSALTGCIQTAVVLTALLGSGGCVGDYWGAGDWCCSCWGPWRGEDRQHVRSRVCHRKEIQLFGSHISKQDSKMNSFLCLTNERSFFHLKYIARQRQGLLLKLNTRWGAFMGFKVTEPIHGLGCHSSCLKRCWVGQKRKQT